MIDDVLDHLEGWGVGTRAISLFAGGFADESADTCVAVLETAGLPGEQTHDIVGIAYERPGLQVLTRSKDYDTARDRARLAYDAMASVVNRLIGSTGFLAIIPRTPPFYIGRDENERAMFSCNYDVMTGKDWLQ
jgi:Bacteriophage minor capsid protein